MPPRNETLGQHLRTLRKRADLTLAEAAKKIGTDAGSLSRIERDQRFPTVPQLRDLAALYGILPSTLAAHLDPRQGRRRADPHPHD